MFEEINIGSPSILVDSDGLILEANNSMSEIFGYDRQELKGQHINVLIPENLRDKHSIGFSNFNSGKKNNMNCFRVKGLKKNGDELFLTISVSKQKHTLLAVMKNTTKNERLERKLLAKLG